MAEYRILDYGYANKTATGTQETRANSGNALSLNVTTLDWGRNTGTNSSANPGRYENSETTYASFTNPVLTLQGVLDIADATYLTQLKALDDMCITRGIKLFYYSENNGSFKPLTETFGATGQVTNQASLIGANIKCLLVRVLSLRFAEPSNRDQTKGLRRYTLQIEVTNPTL